MSYTHQNIDQLVQSLQSGFPSLELIAVYQLNTGKKNQYLNNGNWNLEIVNKILEKDNLTKLDFKEFKLDYLNKGFFLLSEIELGTWLIVGSLDNIYPQINFFLGEIRIEKLDIQSESSNEKIVETKSQTIDDPIIQKLNAARRLQHSILPKIDQFNNLFDKTLIYYQPQDIIGGDIYWMKEYKNSVFIVVADCTGHSVEGALASMTVHSVLNDVIQESLSPLEVGQSFYGKLNEFKIEDDAYSIGVELAITKFEKSNKKLSYASSGLPIILEINKKLDVKKPRKKFSAESQPMDGAMHESNIKVKKGDKIYMFSDGVIDLFDKNNSKKLGWKGIEKITEQLGVNGNFTAQYFENAINVWKGETEQIDDVTLLGIEF
uniref:PP2C family protein-serine/threonine phosphatase n=1 Tax=Fulvivirga sp. TaxID=1931237 RepID=UPI0040497DF1